MSSKKNNYKTEKLEESWLDNLFCTFNIDGICGNSEKDMSSQSSFNDSGDSDSEIYEDERENNWIEYQINN